MGYIIEAIVVESNGKKCHKTKGYLCDFFASGATGWNPEKDAAFVFNEKSDCILSDGQVQTWGGQHNTIYGTPIEKVQFKIHPIRKVEKTDFEKYHSILKKMGELTDKIRDGKHLYENGKVRKDVKGRLETIIKMATKLNQNGNK